MKSLQFQELGWGHPTPPKRHPNPAQSDREPPGLAHLHCVGAASLRLRELRGAVLSATGYGSQQSHPLTTTGTHTPPQVTCQLIPQRVSFIHTDRV